jgi:hypothetical protein
MAEAKLVSVTLGQPAYINGQVRQAGEIVMAPDHMKAALEYVPKKAPKPAEPKDGDKSVPAPS